MTCPFFWHTWAKKTFFFDAVTLRLNSNTFCELRIFCMQKTEMKLRTKKILVNQFRRNLALNWCENFFCSINNLQKKRKKIFWISPNIIDGVAAARSGAFELNSRGLWNRAFFKVNSSYYLKSENYPIWRKQSKSKPCDGPPQFIKIKDRIPGVS